MILFVSGGARSGKSRFAEEKAIELYERRKQEELPGRLVYVATARVTDTEMAQRIDYHQEDRSELWDTIEEPFDLTSIPGKSGIGDVLLVDCLTIWLSNMLYQTQANDISFMPVEIGKQSNYLVSMIDSLIGGAEKKQQVIIFVSNDLNEGEPTVIEPMVSDYVYVMEKVHRHIVDRADSAIQVIAGIPLEWKGEGSL